MMKKEELFATCLGLGRLPVAPGTWGSLPPVVLYMAAGILFGPAAAIGTMIALLTAGCVVTVACSPAVIKQTGSKDPGKIVSDEVAGAALTLLLMQLLDLKTGFCVAAALGFGLFRLFDIVKPWPCRPLEKLPAGWGILADDLMAAIYAAAAALVLGRLAPGFFG
jgi:phosphatidylglycerophosphatase A